MFRKKATQSVQGKIVADEGYKMVNRSGSVALKKEKYIVEVHPDAEPAFRTEVEAWVSFRELPQVGDVLTIEYTPGSQKVNLCIKGDPRFDWELRKTAREAESATARDALLHGPVSQNSLSADTTPSQPNLADDEAQLIAKLEDLENADAGDDET